MHFLKNRINLIVWPFLLVGYGLFEIKVSLLYLFPIEYSTIRADLFVLMLPD
jgi:hypothetical protein